MAAPRNDDMRDKLYTEAMRLFSEGGYKNTTYSDIAKACGISKSMVQYYFPKKELFVGTFIDNELNRLSEEASSGSGEPLEMFCKMGLLQFDKFLNDEELRPFFNDIIESRELTSSIVEQERAWAQRKLSTDADESISVEDALTVSLGGAFELLFQNLKHGLGLTATYIERSAFVPFALVLGYERTDIDAMVDACAEELGVQ